MWGLARQESNISYHDPLPWKVIERKSYNCMAWVPKIWQKFVTSFRITWLGAPWGLGEFLKALVVSMRDMISRLFKGIVGKMRSIKIPTCSRQKMVVTEKSTCLSPLVRLLRESETEEKVDTQAKLEPNVCNKLPEVTKNSSTWIFTWLGLSHTAD